MWSTHLPACEGRDAHVGGAFELVTFCVGQAVGADAHHNSASGGLDCTLVQAEERRRLREEGPRQRRVSLKQSRVQEMMKSAARQAAHYADAMKDAVLGDSDDEMTREESLLARLQLADDCTALLRRDGMDEMVHLMVRVLVFCFRVRVREG